MPKDSELGISHFALRPTYLSKDDVVDLIEGNKGKFITQPKSDPTTGLRPTGPEVHVFPRLGRKYLRTDRNEIEEDNLGDLDTY